MMMLLSGTYFARDASYAHEYTDVKMIMRPTNDDGTSGLSAPNAAAAAAGDENDVNMIDSTTGATDTEASLAADDKDSDNKDARRRLRVMVAARVFVGRYTVGHRTYRKPPALDPTQPFAASFDSCVNYIDDPTLFVIFDSSQCYPEYFVTYCCRSE